MLNKVTWIKGGTFADLRPIPVVGSDALSVMAKSPHLNAALLFANWRYNKEEQESMAREKGGVAVVARLDMLMLIEKQYWPENPVKTWWEGAEWYLFQQYSYSSKGVFKLGKEGMSWKAWRQWVKDTSTLFWGQYPPPTTFFILER